MKEIGTEAADQLPHLEIVGVFQVEKKIFNHSVKNINRKVKRFISLDLSV